MIESTGLFRAFIIFPSHWLVQRILFDLLCYFSHGYVLLPHELGDRGDLWWLSWDSQWNCIGKWVFDRLKYWLLMIIIIQPLHWSSYLIGFTSTGGTKERKRSSSCSIWMLGLLGHWLSYWIGIGIGIGIGIDVIDVEIGTITPDIFHSVMKVMKPGWWRWCWWCVVLINNPFNPIQF